MFETGGGAKSKVVVLRESRDDVIIARSWLSTVESPLRVEVSQEVGSRAQMVIVDHVLP